MTTNSDTTILTGEILYKKIESLKEIKVDEINWVIYYLDEKNNEKWIEEYPYSYAQGGGPPQLRKLEKFPWE